MRKNFIFIFVISIMFFFSAGSAAYAITIDFEDCNEGERIFNQYSSQGVYFRASMSLQEESKGEDYKPEQDEYPGEIAATGYESSRALQPYQSDIPIYTYILLTNPATFLSFYKWGAPEEESKEEPLEEEPEEKITTVYWEFYTHELEKPILVSEASDSTKDSWVQVSYSSNAPISAVKIWGNNPFYLDNLVFETPTSSVPEPMTMLLLGFGLIGLAGLRRNA